MSEVAIHPYEGLFLFPQAAMTDLQGTVDHLKNILSRAGAEVISLRKWDERRLAYEIKGNKRGVYFLVYFRAQTDKLIGIERDCNLSEQLLRVMITRADHVTDDQIQAADGQSELADEIRLRKESEASQAAAAVAEESRAYASDADTAVATAANDSNNAPRIGEDA